MWYFQRLVILSKDDTGVGVNYSLFLEIIINVCIIILSGQNVSWKRVGYGAITLSRKKHFESG